MRDLYTFFSKCAKYLDNKKKILIYLYSRTWFFSSVRWFYATFNALKKIKLLIFFSRCVDTMNTFSFLLKMKLETFMRGFVPGEFCIHGYNQQCWRVRWCKDCFAHNVTTSSITETRYGRCCPYFFFLPFWFNTMNVFFFCKISVSKKISGKKKYIHQIWLKILYTEWW